MRIRFKKWARPELEASPFYIDNPQDYKGKWNTAFKNAKNPIHMELGCGKGTFISQLAVKNSDINYIAIDMVDAMLGLAKRNIESIYKEKELDKLKIELQKVFFKIIKININKAETKQDIEKIIYDFRYYLLLPYDYKNKIKEIEKIQKEINETSKLIINKAIDLKVLEKISNSEKTNYEILKNIFYVKIIKLEDAYLKITKEKEQYFLQIFDENIFEEKLKILEPKNLEIKQNKKISIMSH